MTGYKARQTIILFRIMILLALSVAACNVPPAAPETPRPANSPRPSDTPPPEPTPGVTITPTAAPTVTVGPPTSTPVPTPIPSDLVWFAPNFGSRDYVELFTQPEQWSTARSRIDVFKFYTQNMLNNPCAICGDNTFGRFAEVDAFGKLSEWGIAAGVELGAVKEWGCTGDDEFRVARTVMQNIRSAGGSVTFLAMDEPLLGGRIVVDGRTCGYDMEATSVAAAHFVEQVRTAYPQIIVGDIEPYPRFSAAELEAWIRALEERGVTPEFFHLDVDMVRVRTEGHDVAGDVQRLRQFFRDRQIPFGLIFTSNSNWSAGSNGAYYGSAMEWTRIVNDTIGRPQHVIFQSWVGPAASGAHEVPINLPEDDPVIFSHTRLINEGLDLLEQ